jgi:hypothetical protein
MIDIHDNPRPDIQPPKWARLEELNDPAMSALAKAVHGCSKDPTERTLTATLLVTSLCQLSGWRMMSRSPSTIVVSARDLTPDPIARFVGGLIPQLSEPLTGLCSHGAFNGRHAKDAPRAMEQAIVLKGDLGKVSPLNAADHRVWRDLYFAAQSAGFGSGPCRNYAKAWHELFGLMTDSCDDLILRIESPEDRTAFRKDVVGEARRLRQPMGYGPSLTWVPKHISLFGSLASSDWDTPLANSLVNLGLPLLVLPSSAAQLPCIPSTGLQFIARCMPKYLAEPLDEPANFLQTPWFDRYAEELRSRLSFLPLTYDYSMHKLARQLYPACLRIANWCGTYSGTDIGGIAAMAKDLCGHSLRGLVLSVAGLAWHGLGFDTGCPHREFMRVLDYLRLRGPMSKSDLHHRGHIENSKTRDKLVERFEAENLIRVDGRNVKATTYGEFVESLYAREKLPQPEDFWRKATGRSAFEDSAPQPESDWAAATK